jgi:hypothetical protein
VNVVIDSTGLKVFGAGEWRRQKHRGKGRWTWRKLHLAVDPDTGEIVASELTSTELVRSCRMRLVLQDLALLPETKKQAKESNNEGRQRTGLAVLATNPQPSTLSAM